MHILTITCHDVYNHGASLQGYALQTYLESCGYEVEIIDYKPDYLSGHYSLSAVSNPRYDKPIVRQMYLLAKLPERLAALKRKRAFDGFTAKYLKLSDERYVSNEQLKQNLPEADAYIAGSDQIWNTLFRNGKDPAFYLDFAPDNKIKMAYAASFATDKIADGYEQFVHDEISRLDYISVRESSAVDLLKSMGIDRGVQVCDPVFLLPREYWQGMLKDLKMPSHPYVLVYDCEKSRQLADIAKEIAKRKNCRIYSVSAHGLGYPDKEYINCGPLDFVSLIANAEYVISNSFHATAFSLIFKRPFCVVNRSEKINTRMQDLLSELGLPERLVSKFSESLLIEVNFANAMLKLQENVDFSKKYLSVLKS
jgi:hypothetical protein